jgi:integrase
MLIRPLQSGGAITRGENNHSRPMTSDQLAAYYGTLGKYGGYRGTIIALSLLPMLFLRTGELRLASWSEFDLDKAVWEIPAGRMKRARAHIVPLAAPAVALLRELRKITAGGLLFPGLKHPGTPLSATTLNRALEYLDLKGGAAMTLGRPHRPTCTNLRCGGLRLSRCSCRTKRRAKRRALTIMLCTSTSVEQ